MLLLPDAALAERRRLVAPDAPFAGLADSLAADLDLVLVADVHVADRKARLTRAGGRCPVHGTEFAFDPFSPHTFRCAAGGTDYTGDEHHEFWLYRYQLWLAERAVHAAALHALLGRPAYAAFAARVLAEAADVYPRLPNRDNVLGPTRPFFSTYLESLWLLSLCVALDFLESADGVSALGGRVRDQLVAPSRALIASYPEGRSNRQVWNASAGLAAARVLGDPLGAERAVHGRDGLTALLRDGLLADGTWYEGENYHQFAHRGLWYGVTMAERAGLALNPALTARFDRGFGAPFLVAMPWDELPARRDAQFGVSLRQWRWAEWLELGVARPPNDLPDAEGGTHFLARWLRRLYRGPHVSSGGTGRWRASGEAELNESATNLSRASLGWKSLLFARAELLYAGIGTQRAESWPGSVLLPEQGYAVLRGPRPWFYASLDYGRPGGGHGHPDRLNVQVPPQLLDPGTGSYVDPTLHWYRSTLAHAAPLVGERSQPPATGRLLGFDLTHAPEFQAVGAEAEIAPGVTARRWLVLTPRYLVDRLTWTGLGDRPLDLALGGGLVGASTADEDRRRYTRLGGLPWQPVARPGAGGLEDGFDFLTDVEAAPFDVEGFRLVLRARELGDEESESLWLQVFAPPGAELWRATAPLAPGHGTGPMCAVRAWGDAGAITIVHDFSEYMHLGRVDPDGTITLPVAVGMTDVLHAPSVDGVGGWLVREERTGEPPREVRLATGPPTPRPRRRPAARAAATPAPATPAPADYASVDHASVDHASVVDPAAGRAPRLTLTAGAPPLTFDLGERHYRRSEETWHDAGRPTALVALAVRDDRLHVDVAVRLGRPTTFVPPGTDNPLDNERAGTNGDGLQLHLGVAVGAHVEPIGAWLLVPVPPGRAVDVTRTSAPDPTAEALTPAATWAPAADGWTLATSLPLAPLRTRAAALGVTSNAPTVAALDVLVNEMPDGRERRRGQLVLSGLCDPDERVYLAGDRQDAGRLLRVALPPG